MAKSARIVKNIFKGTISSQTLQISSFILNILYSIILLRLLPPREIGLLELAGAPLGILYIAAGFGLDQAVINFVSKNREKGNESGINDVLLTAFILRMGIIFICSCLMFLLSEIIAAFYGATLLVPLLRIKIIQFFVSSLGGIAGATFTAYHKYEYSVYILVSNRLLSLVIVPILIILGFGVVGAAFGELVSAIVLTTVTLFVWKRFFPQKTEKFRFKVTIKQLLSYGVPLGVGDIFYSIQDNSGKLILGVFGPPEWIAYYTLAYNLASFPIKIASSLNTALFPTMSELEGRNEENYLQKTFKMTFNFLTILSVFLIGSFLLLTETIIVLLYTIQYLPAVVLAQIVVTVNLLWYWGIPTNNLLLAKGKTKVITAGNIVRAILTVSLELLSIPIFGLIGACISKVIGIAADILILVLYFKIRTDFQIDFRFVAKMNLIFGFSLCVSYILNLLLISTFLIYGLFIGIFLVLVIVFRGFTRKDFILLSPILDFLPQSLAPSAKKIGSFINSVLREEKHEQEK